MPGCAAFNCSNRTEQGYALKIFPKDPDLRAVWTSKVKRLNWTPTNSSYLCEVHFAQDQWESIKANGSRKLKKNAVPTLFSHSSVQLKRKSPLERVEETKRMKTTTEMVLNEHDYSALQPNKDTIIAKLQADLSSANIIIKNLQQENLLLKAKLRQKIIQNSKYKNTVQKMKHPEIQNIFNADQIEAMRRKSMAFRKWSNKTVEVSLGLKFSCGVKGYENLIHLNLPYPSVRTLQRRVENLNFHSGILDEVFELLKIKVKAFTKEHEKYCVLLLDEMGITEAIQYDIATNTYFGNVTFPGQKGKANYALVFMLGGISTRWKQTVAYFFTNGQVNGDMLKNVVLKIILKEEEIGLHIMSVTSDMGSANQAMWKAFGIACGRICPTQPSIPNPCDSTRRIYFIADVPHLLKNIRTSLLANKYFVLPKHIQERWELPSDIINPKHLEYLVEYQSDMDLKLAPKITESHLKDKHFNKMKVSRATNVISHDVSTALKFLSDENHSFLTTAWFIERVSKWFDLMTSRHPVLALSKANEEEYIKALSFLREMIELFKSLKIVSYGGKTVWKPIQTGLILSTTSMLHIQENLLGEKSFKFLLTSRFTQDSLENLFGVVRTKQVIPTALQFRNNLKLVCVAQYLKKSSRGSYQEDDRAFLSGFLDIIKEKPASNLTKIVLPQGWNKNSLSMTEAEENCLYNIAGYIMSRISKYNVVCETCFGAVASKEKTEATCAKLVALRAFNDNCLFYVKEHIFYSLFCPLEILFRSLEPFLLNVKNCKEFVHKKIVTDKNFSNVMIPECHSIKEKIKNRFIAFRLKIHGFKKNKEIVIETKSNSLGAEFGSKSSAMRLLAERT